jgi:hypothetical protein
MSLWTISKHCCVILKMPFDELYVHLRTPPFENQGSAAACKHGLVSPSLLTKYHKLPKAQFDRNTCGINKVPYNRVASDMGKTLIVGIFIGP